MSQRIAVCALSIPKILDLLNDDESDNFSFLPPVKPKGGEIILYRARSESEKGKQPSKVEPGFTLLCMLVLTVYCTFILCLDDWRSDQYRWVNQGVHLLPKKNPVIRKTYITRFKHQKDQAKILLSMRINFCRLLRVT